jgi:hypothetical protein
MRFIETPVFTKNEQGDRTAAQVRQLARLVREEFK